MSARAYQSRATKRRTRYSYFSFRPYGTKLVLLKGRPMLRISKLTDYATVILARLAAEPAQRFTAAQIAAETHLAAPTVSKLLKQLHRQGLVASTRGSAGGYLLARPASDISAAQILDALRS